MPKRKKYPKLPNGYGSIKYLGKSRRNPYAVHPPATEFGLNGSPITPRALCYTDAWIKGFTVLTAFRAGTYYPGMELTLNLENEENGNLENLAQKILADYNISRPVEKERKEQLKTFSQVYKEFYDWKFVQDKSRAYSNETMSAMTSAFKRCSALHEKPLCDLKHDDLQKVLDDCKLSHASLEHMLHLMHQMYKYAMIKEIAEKDYSRYVKINKADDDVPGEPFSEDELKMLWGNKDNPIIEFLLIMCYSGYRIKAYETIEVNIHDAYFKGGIKTKSSKDRIVPIHSAIFSLVEKRMLREGEMLKLGASKYRYDLYKTLKSLGIKKHTPHDCRHTFSMLGEKYGMNENDRKRMLGHSFSTDITNGIYGHRSLEDLKKEIEKIKVCY